MRKRPVKVGTKIEPTEHGPETVCYANDGIAYRPLIVCLCGWVTEHGPYNWEEAGVEFDEHLAEAAMEEQRLTAAAAQRRAGVAKGKRRG
jgi:hypothetical protein